MKRIVTSIVGILLASGQNVDTKKCIPAYRASIVKCNNKFSDASGRASYFRTTDAQKYKKLSHEIIKNRADCKEKAKQSWHKCRIILAKKSEKKPVINKVIRTPTIKNESYLAIEKLVASEQVKNYIAKLDK